MDQYQSLDALFYDSAVGASFDGDLEFYVAEAVRIGGPALELGCGTGRITLPIAEAGVEITGSDLSPDMLRIAEAKAARLAPEVRAKVRFTQGDMRNLLLDGKFRLIICPFRAFLHNLTVEDQTATLKSVHNLLTDNGMFIFNVFDPNLRILVEHTSSLSGALKKMHEFKHPISGNKVIEWECRAIDLVEQRIEELRIHEEFDDLGRSVNRTAVPLHLRWIYRWEMEHLLQLCGFKVEALFGDFKHGPFKHGGEQIWLVQKNARTLFKTHFSRR
ncbi:MAG: methyltransferase domain-containing protein [Calditrichaeota bacterium]|nr:methyltransferase domain-containing protein [Calditrichota bacterium]